MRMSRATVMLLLAAGLSGCNGSHPSSPLTPTPAGGSTPAPNPNLVGYVIDTAYRAVGGATVTVVNGPQAGTSMTTNAEGRFTYSQVVTSAVTFRASKEGYLAGEAASRTSAPGGTPWVYIQLEAVASPVNIEGDYTLTLTADSTCVGIPSELRTRTYAVTIEPRSAPPARPGTAFTLLALGSPLLDNYRGFPIGVAGDYVASSIYNGEDFGLVERIAPKTFLAFYGSAGGVVDASTSTISAPLDGGIEYCVSGSEMAAIYNCMPALHDSRALCVSKNHHLTLTRR
jgi:hypothetical protein